MLLLLFPLCHFPKLQIEGLLSSLFFFFFFLNDDVVVVVLKYYAVWQSMLRMANRIPVAHAFRILMHGLQLIHIIQKKKKKCTAHSWSNNDLILFAVGRQSYTGVVGFKNEGSSQSGQLCRKWEERLDSLNSSFGRYWLFLVWTIELFHFVR